MFPFCRCKYRILLRSSCRFFLINSFSLFPAGALLGSLAGISLWLFELQKLNLFRTAGSNRLYSGSKSNEQMYQSFCFPLQICNSFILLLQEQLQTFNLGPEFWDILGYPGELCSKYHQGTLFFPEAFHSFYYGFFV